MANTDDLRFVRTEEAMRSAFMELLSERSVDSITASAVCRRAGISRNAFYLHHTGVAELYAAMVDELLSDIRDACFVSAKKVSGSRAYDEDLIPAGIVVLGRHEALLRALLPSDDGTLAKRLAKGIADTYVEAATVFGEQGTSLEHRLRCEFSAWAYIGLLQSWFELSDEPIAGLLPYVQDFYEGIQLGATRYLTGEK